MNQESAIDLTEEGTITVEPGEVEVLDVVPAKKEPAATLAVGSRDDSNAAHGNSGVARKPTVAEKDLMDYAVKKHKSNVKGPQDGMIFEISGTPKTKARPQKSKAGYLWNPSKADEKRFREMAERAVVEKYGSIFKFEREVPVVVSLQFRFAEKEFHLQRAPDIDNLSKLVLDSLNKVFYHDDRQVVTLHAFKGTTTSAVSSTVVAIAPTTVFKFNPYEAFNY